MHEFYMNMAIEEAKKGQNHTFTNPLVGAVIVKNNRIIARGAHLKYGSEHAERQAINQCLSSEELINSTLYVTLEPCHHYGKQPPCTEIIVNSGISKVIIGQLDPNPLVSGKGKDFLEKQGIDVLVGVKEKEVRLLNEKYNFLYQTKRPFITLKQAMTLDGKIAFNHSTRTAITNEAVWEKVHIERGQYQAILIGSQTALSDNPTLLPLELVDNPPIRIVIDRSGRTLSQPLALFEDNRAPVWIFTEKDQSTHFPDHVKIIQNTKWALHLVIEELARQNINALYVEGGSLIHDSFLKEGLWDEIITYLSPKIMGGSGVASFQSAREVNQLVSLNAIKVEKLGHDLRISGRRINACSQD